MDLVDAVLKTVVYFAETGFSCFSTGSLKPLLMSKSELVELDTEYGTIVSWWDLVKNGNLEKVQNVTDAEFDRRLSLLTTRVLGIMPSLNGFEKKVTAEKHTRLLQMRNDYVTMKLSCGMRKAPFVIKLFGKSSQGKTTYGDQVIQALLTSAGLPTERDFRVNYNVADKYMSTMKTNCVVMTLDDFANTKPDFMDQSPTQVLINVCNNQPCYANMADLAQKGKVFIEPRIVMINTNKEDLDAYTYSNCPYSIQRRPNVDIEIVAKPEFQYVIDGKPCGVDAEKVAKWNLENGAEATFDDIWFLTFKKAVEPGDLKCTATYKVVEHRGKKLERVGFTEALEYMIELYHKHDAAQNAIMEKTKILSKDLRVCGIDGCKNICGACRKHDHSRLDRQFGYEDAERMWRDTRARVSDELAFLVAHEQRWAWMDRLPDLGVFNMFERFSGYMSTAYSFTVLSTMNIAMGSLLQSAVWACGFAAWSHVFSTVIMTWCLFQQKHLVRMFRETRLGMIVGRVSFTQIANTFRNRTARQCIGASAIVASLFVLASMYKTWRAIQKQGSLEPKDKDDVDERAAEENVWTKVALRSLPSNEKSRTTTFEQLKALVDKNLTYVSIEGTNGKTLRANALFLKTGVVVMPNHYFADSGGGDMVCTFRKVNPEACGGKFQAILSKINSYELEGRDLSICYVASGGSFKDLTGYLPTSNITSHVFELMYRSRDGSLLEAKGMAQVRLTGNGTGGEFIGSVYRNLTMNTFGGLCGAVQLSSGRVSSITGIHLGGLDNTPNGCSGPLYKYDYDVAIEHLRNQSAVLIGGEDGVFDRQVYGVNVTNDIVMHKKDPINFMPENSQVEYYGGCPGFVTPHSDVKVTPISAEVMMVCGVPNIYRGPKINPHWYGWQTCIQNLANPARMFNPSLLAKAVEDFKLPLLPLFGDHETFGPLRPLTDIENTNGIPGVQFIDSINMATSKGFPLSGPKKDIVSPIDDETYPDGVVFDQFVLDHVAQCEERYARGERCHPIIKGCVKDEILSKDKCRIFYGNPLTLTFLIRRYFLPLIRVLQLNPIKSECAVGVNCFGPEWRELYSSVTKFGEDRLVGGDYGKYDQKVPSQLVLAALRVLIDFGKQAGYCDRDLRIMEAMSADIAFAKIAFNGSLIGLTEGTHISGNSLTAVLNGIMGSLNARVYYFSNPKIKFDSFRDAVSFMTYGDDNVGSVNPKCDTFTIKGMSEFLGEHGQVYTMPDKESELVDFLPVEEFEFLKRVNVYIPEIGCNVGALLEKSIFKSLHCFMRGRKSPLTEEEASAQNIDTALREFFNHGREVYERRRCELKEVAENCGIDHMCTRLSVTFDDHVAEWREKYYGERMEKAEIRFGRQSGVERDLYAETAHSIPMKLIGKNIPFVDTTFGEIDMLFEKTVNGKSYILVVEVKHSLKKTAKAKGVSQLLKSVRALRSMRPDASFSGLLVTMKNDYLVVKTHKDHEQWFSIFRRQSSKTLILSQDEPLLYI
jgi:hypothetical protein